MVWTLAHSTQSNSFSSGSSFAITVPAVASGNVIIVCTLTSGTGAPTSVTDNKSNTYNTVGAGIVNGGLNFMNFIPSAQITNGTTQVTVHSTGTWTGIEVTIDEFSPPAGTSSISLDGNHYDGSFAGSATTVTGTSFTTTGNGDLVFSSIAATTPVTAGTGFTLDTQTNFIIGEYLTQASAGSIAASAVTGGSGDWTLGALAIKAVSSVTPDSGGSHAIFRVQTPGWRWRLTQKYKMRDGLLLKAARCVKH